MTTLATLKSRIADDISRSDLTTQIANSITDAITYYQNRRFFFNETRSETFDTVAAQSLYRSSDDAAIPTFARLDGVFLLDSSIFEYELERYDPLEMELLLDASAPSERPYAYAYFEEAFRLYPIPDVSTYDIRPVGVIEKIPPAGDADTDNVWMTHGFEMIRCRAKYYLFAHVIRQMDKAILFRDMANDAMLELRKQGTDKMHLGRIEAMDF